MVKVVVVGAGVVGLSSALAIQESLPDSQVTVIADAFSDLTSHIAAGIFRPTLALMQGVPTDIARKWINTSWERYNKLLFSTEGGRAGFCALSGYHVWGEGGDSTKKPMTVDEYSYHFKMLNEKELEMFPGRKLQRGCFFTTIQIETKDYLPWLVTRIKNNGGTFIKRKVHDLKELHGHYDVVVNCAGLRATELTNDRLLLPNRGQMFRVKAPWIRHFQYVDNDTWIVPGFDRVAVGGTRLQNDGSTEIRQADADSMWARAVAIVPSLKFAEDKKIVVGLRPSRRPTRVEAELLKFGNKQLKVVHNYGHGGNGVALSWGTAVHTAELVKHQLGRTTTALSAKY